MQSKAQDPTLELLINYYKFFIAAQSDLKYYTILPDDEIQKLDLFYRDNLASLINLRDDLINKTAKEQIQSKASNIKLPRNQNQMVIRCVTYYLNNPDVSYDVSYEFPILRDSNRGGQFNAIYIEKLENSLNEILSKISENNNILEVLNEIKDLIDASSSNENDNEKLLSEIREIFEERDIFEMERNLDLLKSAFDPVKNNLDENILEVKTALTNSTQILNQSTKITGQLLDSTAKAIMDSQQKIIPNLREDIQSALKSELVNFFQQTNKIVLANSRQIVELERKHKRTNTTILIITVGAIIFTSVASSFIAAKFYTNKLMGYITIGKTHK